jgi:hypothetical protein
MSVTEHQVTSPFQPTELFAGDGNTAAPAPTGEGMLTPFSEAAAGYDELQQEAEAVDALLAEFEDESFEEALEMLADEAAARHLRSVRTWSAESEAPGLATSEAEQWIGSVAAEADRVLGELETYFADRPIDSLRDGEMETVAGLGDWESLGFVSPFDAQEQFFKKVLNKAKKVAKGVAKVARKGIGALGKLGLGKLFGILRKLVQPLLKRVLAKAIGRLPAPLRPVAEQLAKRFSGEAEAEGDEHTGYEMLAESFDRQVAELVLAPSDAALDRFLGEAESEVEVAGDAEPLHDLDAARTRLARELADATPGEAPTAAMERFIPAVMGAMPLIRIGLRVIGRQRVVNFLAGALAKLIQGMVGPQPARLLSRHIADAGLKLLGLEAENGADPTVGTEALVAATEDTVRQVMSLPPESLADERVLEAEIQEAFAEAAARHLPSAVLRPDVVEGESEDEHAVWVLMPRTTRPLFRYKKYGRLIPVRITRPVARSLAMTDGETLEQRLLDAGVTAWPVEGEMEAYELLAGAELGHLAAFEDEEPDPDADAASLVSEFEELTEAAATALAGHPRLAATGRRGRSGRRRQGGTRYYRLRVGGRRLARRRPFALRLDVTSPQPVLKVHLRIGERDSQTLAAHIEQRKMIQIVSVVRGLLGPAAQKGMAQRLNRMLSRHGIEPGRGSGVELAGRLADAMVRAVSKQLPDAAATLDQAAKNPAPGITLTFAFTFADKASIATSQPSDPTLTIRPGQHDD